MIICVWVRVAKFAVSPRNLGTFKLLLRGFILFYLFFYIALYFSQIIFC